MNKVRMRLKEKPVSDRIPAEIKRYIDDLRAEDHKMILGLVDQVNHLTGMLRTLTEVVNERRRTPYNIGGRIRPHTRLNIDIRSDQVHTYLRQMGVDLSVVEVQFERRARLYGLSDLELRAELDAASNAVMVLVLWISSDGDHRQVGLTLPVDHLDSRRYGFTQEVQERLVHEVLEQWDNLYGVHEPPPLNIRITDHT